MKRIFLIPLSVAVVAILACLAPHESQALDAPTPSKTNTTSFEGSWTGRDSQGVAATLKVTGQTMDYHATDADDWLQGTFTLREDTTPKQFIGVITNCAAAENIGKKCYAIYKIENGTLTISGSAPGETNFPASFDAPEARKFVFQPTK
jgi:uncharacterized protein (TIGR03067 family)